MLMNTAYNISLAAMQAAHAQIANAARQIANPRADESNIIDAVIAIKQAEQTHDAATAAMRTASDMSEQLIDILA
ncbi:hypothetical protein V0U79_03105 [Hyphobacterium sp. HN65]|uniref:Flagellar basal-body/hook protein C-terminal domain-containing protein n=1 Tax=Hyphobacterium lacteum TaxID=3116575 RepID=A0ABU7LN47_9PROT|nr:hypothetical protein [Hyphobacterium sp. HN65]MEE2525340.1 hypothetical protein [Hyphobacterium sp. HN65]